MRSNDTPVPESHLPLHALEFQILLTLSETSTHAYAIVRNIEERQPDWSKILPTNLYRRIWRLAAEGLIEGVAGDPPSGERRRKYFTITSLGRQVALAESERLRHLLLQAEQAGILRSPTGTS